MVLGLVGGLGQLAIAFMGDAIGGMSVTVELLAIDAVIAIAGALITLRWRAAGGAVMLVAGVGAAIAIFSTTWLEIGVAALLLGAAAATLVTRSVRG